MHTLHAARTYQLLARSYPYTPFPVYVPMRSVRGYVCLAAANSGLNLEINRKIHRRSGFYAHHALERKGRPGLLNRAIATDSILQTPQHAFTDFKRTNELHSGTLVIKLLTPDEMEQTAHLLVETYFSTYNFGPYKRYLMYQMRGYLRERMSRPPKAVVLVATLYSSTNGTAEAAGSSSQHCEMGSSAEGPHPPLVPSLVGTAEVSFCSSVRSSTPTLKPPKDCAFLTNMAVDPAFRRQGIATQMLKAAYDVAALAGQGQILLHVRVKDEPARELYRRDGFVVREEDNFLVLLLGRDMKQLLQRPV